jgi:hypothetical protein
MKRTIFSAVLLACVSLVLGLSGCYTTTRDSDDGPRSGSSTGVPAKNGDHADHADHDDEMKEVRAELAKLSDEDRASAEKQRICPVSEELLGSMPGMKKVEVNGQQVWLCCGGCEKELRDNADVYLAKLKQQ